MTDKLDRFGRRPLFAVDGVTFTWSDVLARASSSGSLAALQVESQRGLALVRCTESFQENPDPQAVSAAAVRFRRERGLLSAEELDAWLERWGLNVEEWGEYLERSLLLDRSAGEAAPPRDAVTADDEEALFVDAVCSGFFEREALALAEEAALARVPGDEASGDRQALVERVGAVAAEARANAVSESGVSREIAAHGLDWTLLDLDVLELADVGAAREAALCVRVDGRPIADVASDCGTPLQHMTVYLDDVEPDLLPPLLAARPGELIGPVEHDGAFVLFEVRERTLPEPEDTELRRRAEAALLERMVKGATASRVEWHEPI